MSRQPFEYAVLRAVPRVDRGECINVGVLLYCQASSFLAARWHVDADRLRALHADVDVPAIQAALDAVQAACAGESRAGPAGEGPPGPRFRLLVSPRSTVLQAGPVHTGLTDDPERELDHLLAQLVS
jgi:hypothetical protein